MGTLSGFPLSLFLSSLFPMETINVRHQSFLVSFSFCGLAEVDLTLAALNRAFPNLWLSLPNRKSAEGEA
jgi:hypothetical protein